jgi:hypothetical protein
MKNVKEKRAKEKKVKEKIAKEKKAKEKRAQEKRAKEKKGSLSSKKFWLLGSKTTDRSHTTTTSSCTFILFPTFSISAFI